MMLGRTIRLAGAEEIVGGRARWYTRGFVTADVTTLVVQGLGESFIFFLSLFFGKMWVCEGGIGGTDANGEVNRC